MDPKTQPVRAKARLEREYFPERLDPFTRVVRFVQLAVIRLDLAWSYIARDREQVINDYLSLGAYWGDLGNVSVARGYFGRAKLAARKNGLARLTGQAAYNLGVVAFRQDDWDQVISELEPEFPNLRLISDGRLACSGVIDLGIAYQKVGNSARAAELFREALSLATELRIPSHRGLAMRCLGGIDYDAKRWDAAARWWGESLSVFRVSRDRRGVAMMSFWLGAAELGRGDVEKAAGLLEESRNLYKKLGVRDLAERSARTLEAAMQSRRSE